MFKSKIDKLYKQLRSQGKLTTLPVEQVSEISERIHNTMSAYRHELTRKAAQSEVDTAKIVLNV